MEEIEAVCNRVAIIDYGRMLQSGTLDELLDRTRAELCVRVKEVPSDLATQLRSIAAVHADPDGSTRIVIQEKLESRNQVSSVQLRAVLDFLDQAKVPLVGIETSETSLETLFLRLTGRKLRD